MVRINCNVIATLIPSARSFARAIWKRFVTIHYCTNIAIFITVLSYFTTGFMMCITEQRRPYARADKPVTNIWLVRPTVDSETWFLSFRRIWGYRTTETG